MQVLVWAVLFQRRIFVLCSHWVNSWSQVKCWNQILQGWLVGPGGWGWGISMVAVHLWCRIIETLILSLTVLCFIITNRDRNLTLYNTIQYIPISNKCWSRGVCNLQLNGFSLSSRLMGPPCQTVHIHILFYWSCRFHTVTALVIE